jgi:hypothetical protein
MSSLIVWYSKWLLSLATNMDLVSKFCWSPLNWFLERWSPYIVLFCLKLWISLISYFIWFRFVWLNLVLLSVWWAKTRNMNLVREYSHLNPVREYSQLNSVREYSQSESGEGKLTIWIRWGNTHNLKIWLLKIEAEFNISLFSGLILWQAQSLVNFSLRGSIRDLFYLLNVFLYFCLTNS